MTCTRTGAHIYLWQYGEFAYCDAFEVKGNWDDTKGSGDVAYFRIVQTSHQPLRPLVHYIVHDVDNWFKDFPTSTLITKADGFSNLGYDGRPIKEVLPHAG